MGFPFFLVNEKYCIIIANKILQEIIIQKDIMKTKNILKIGALSIILLSLLISPILKSDIFQAKAQETTCQEANGICQAYRDTCPNDYKEAYPPLECPSGVSKPKCCVPSDSPYIKPPSSERAEYVDTVEITGTAKESNAAKFCNELYGSPSLWGAITGSEDDTWWAHKLCLLQIGTLEGIGKTIGGMINSLTANIFWALNPETYGGFVKNTAVVGLWTILRNFMNLALVLILIIIAISTILGIKKYRWQEILWKLVLIALLINFSLILPGVLLDISHFITYTFINLTQSLNDNESIAQTVMNLYLTGQISGHEKYAFDLSDIKDTVTVDGQSIKARRDGWGLSWGNFLLVLASLGLIGLFALISLVAIFFTIMFRSFMIIILLAVSPIAFAAWVLPNTEKFWQLWWGQFTRWCLFPITFAISLYAGIFVLLKMNDHLAAMGASNEKLGIIAMIIQIILFSMFLIGGLIVSIQSGGVVAKVVQKQVSRAGWLAGAFVSKKTTGAVKESSTYKKAGKLLTKVPLLGGVGQEMMVAGEKAKTGRVKEHEKNLENVGLGNLKELEKAKAPSPLDRNAYERRIALTNKLAETGGLGHESVEFIKAHKGDGRLSAGAITKAIPHYFNLKGGQLIETGDSVEDKVKALAAMKPDKIKDKAQLKDFIEDIKEKEVKEAIDRGAWLPNETDKATDEAYDKIFQNITKNFSASQQAAFWKGLSPKYLADEQLGGQNGKIVQAIKKDAVAKKRFIQQLKDSRPFREESSIDPNQI